MALPTIEGLSTDRVQDSAGIDFDDISCSICRDILWKPVACQSCDTPFCSACITRWLETNPRKCPLQCAKYTEKACNRFINKQLAKLQITCIYQSSGCQEIVSYEALEKHEAQCDYRIEECSGCHSKMLKQELIEHVNECALIELTCTDCQLTFLRSDADEVHTDILCVEKQLKDVQSHSQEKIKRLEDDLENHKRQLHKLRQDCTEHTRKLTAMKKMIFDNPIRITFDDMSDVSMTYGTIPLSYKSFRWTNFSYMHKQYAKLNYSDKGYATAFAPNGSQYIGWSSSSASIRADRNQQVFGIVSFEACAVYNDNVRLTITGYRNSIQIHTHTTTLLFGKSELTELCWTDIDTLKFESFGGTSHLQLNNASHFILTSLIVTAPR